MGSCKLHPISASQALGLLGEIAFVRGFEGFEHKWGFPQCAGAVDGTHIPIVSPEECPADYYNRKGWHSVRMQSVVNHLGHFTNVYVGWVHDARVFASSALYVQGQESTLLAQWNKRIGSKDVPLFLLGDPAYPHLSWVMKAFQIMAN